ncbi:hypothetical protein VTN77DRAFT_264 [Rasamsonia byssochlamydoides]|uniref:uncharacterized protein n=1 Tax=Rasamsonia byssochlamydoides TaxID=89139 RepID=UPI0037432E25
MNCASRPQQRSTTGQLLPILFPLPLPGTPTTIEVIHMSDEQYFLSLDLAYSEVQNNKNNKNKCSAAAVAKRKDAADRGGGSRLTSKEKQS